ncbi:MAG: NAD-glutamate dehydrogenase [Pseudomonadales bacterium]
MTKININNKAAFQTELEKRLAEYIGEDEQIRKFTRLYFSQIPLSELQHKDWDFVLASLKSSWSFFSRFDGTDPIVRVFNPSVKEHGYELKGTVVEIAATNIPFLIDSIRIEFNTAGLVLTDVHQCLLSVARDGKRMVITEDGHVNETLIHFEVEGVRDLKHLEDNIKEVIGLVQQVVNDFAPMRKRLLFSSDEVGVESETEGSDELIEDYEFLRWLYANNFTFVGYEEFVKSKNAKTFKRVPEACLGLAKPGMTADSLPFNPGKQVITVAKAPVKSPVHRPAYFDTITIVRSSSDNGIRACRFIGLFTASVYNQPPTEIPIVRKKIDEIYYRSGLAPSSHKGREIGRIVEMLPREELFLSSSEQLSGTVMKIYALQERRIVRVLCNRHSDDNFVTFMVYMPKDTYDTEIRRTIQELLCSYFDYLDVSFTTFFSESALTRTYFVLRINPDSSTEVDVNEVERRVTELTRSWEDDLHEVLLDKAGETRGRELFERFGHVFGPGYTDEFSPEMAARDIDLMLELSDDNPLVVDFHSLEMGERVSAHFKVINCDRALPLSDIIPILENLGVRVIEEHPYEIELGDQDIWIHDFLLELVRSPGGDLAEVRDKFEEAFLDIWFGYNEDDRFNRLIPAANMTCRDIGVLRAYAKYLGQFQGSYSQAFVADCLIRYSDIAKSLFDLFQLGFDPECQDKNVHKRSAKLKTEILAQIDGVENLSDDRTLRRFVEMIGATRRTNYYQKDSDGRSKSYISLKFEPEEITEMPLPKPKYEIFVHSPRVEGVHLRNGKVARGGLRWSDRSEDYRTEILGLVKAQQVKNSVIVPVGAKGGFLPKKLPRDGGRDAIQVEAIECYRIFIQGLLDVTDNLVKGKVVPPPQTVKHDDDDYYLVVAADKGTASFSDIANSISEEYGFWLGDAFASGGSVGYDHKAMGITARGAWISVQQHFRDQGINVQDTNFTVIGIGDMSGDVFGNGMLLSRHICLVAAFNHLNIFVDPDPDPEASFKERERLFNLGRSSWTDYDEKLISKGGGVFSRSAKSIAISSEMKKLLNISEKSLTPNQLITALLKAKVDLLWNGGIGTYVKSHEESHLDVGDKANDTIRVNASDLNCKVIGEGGNLGMTQLSRVEFNLNGGVCFTDFIDNAGGVNCSDTEVNIKILLNQLLEEGEVTPAARKSLLHKMTDEVAEIVLENNYDQALAINLMSYQAPRRMLEYSRVVSELEEKGQLNRGLEYLPNDEQLAERRSKGQSFTPPELAVIASYVKAVLKEELAASPVLDETWLKKEMEIAFPSTLIRKHGDKLDSHRLRRELVATQIANGMVNRMGANFVTRAAESAGAEPAIIAKAYVAARDIFRMDKYWDGICSLDHQVPPEVQKDMMLNLIRLVRRATRWLLRNRRHSFNLDEEIPSFQHAVSTLFGMWGSLLQGEALKEWNTSISQLEKQGVGHDLAAFVAAAHHMNATLGIFEASRRTNRTLKKVAGIYFAVGEKLQLHWFSRQIHDYQASTQWQALARESMQDDLNWQQVAITLGVIGEGGKNQSAEKMVDRWVEGHHTLVNRWMSLQSDMRASGVKDTSIFTVAIRELLDLAQASSGAKARF